MDRKRLRENDEAESLPLSKRINLLHINTQCDNCLANGVTNGYHSPDVLAANNSKVDNEDPSRWLPNGSCPNGCVPSSTACRCSNACVPNPSETNSICSCSSNVEPTVVYNRCLSDTGCNEQNVADAAAVFSDRLLVAVASAHQSALHPADGINHGRLARELLNFGIYEPELDAGSNPEYYHINAVLFGAHQQRTQRYGHLFYEQ